MKKKFIKIAGLGGLCVAAACAAQALDSAVVIANSGVSADSLSADVLKDIYTAKTKYWDGGQAVVIAVLPDKTDAALQQACGMDSSALKTFWQRLVFSGRGQEPKHADDAASLVALVAATKGAVAIVPADTVLTGVKKVEIK